MGVQVQSATKYINGEGKLSSLSILNRQFISFSYGGKNIEDFDLLAVFNNDRLDKEIYASFNDTITEQAELDGQMFWRSNFKAGQLNFSLATDGMTSAQLEDFKTWFHPGIERELILSEYHNRGIKARVANAPRISLLPFEQEILVKVGDNFSSTKISLYKGNIILDFVMDDPYWYSLKPYLENLEKEDLKIFYEDGVPHESAIKTSCLLADNYCSRKTDNIFKIVPNSSGIILSGSMQADTYLYYCGTAPEKPIISFKLIPIINETSGKISFAKTGNDENYYLSIGVDENYQKLEFNLPSLFSSYNKAIDIVLKYGEGTSILDLRKELRDNIFNYFTRSYVMSIIDYAKNNKIYISSDGKIDSLFEFFFIEQMKNFFIGNLECTINNKNGEVLISGKINLYNGELMKEEETLIPVTSQTITENAGNMIKSNYLIIETRNLPENGWIRNSNCLFIKTNTEMFDLKIDYKYKYL